MKTLSIRKDVLLATKKSNENAAEAENDFRLLNRLEKYSEEYKEIVADILNERKRRRVKQRSASTIVSHNHAKWPRREQDRGRATCIIGRCFIAME